MNPKPKLRCAIYTRKSNEEGLEQEFNSLDAQRDVCDKFIQSQRGEGWVPIPDHYDDGGFTGGNTDRPALQKLLSEIKAGKLMWWWCTKLTACRVRCSTFCRW